MDKIISIHDSMRSLNFNDMFSLEFEIQDNLNLIRETATRDNKQS